MSLDSVLIQMMLWMGGQMFHLFQISASKKGVTMKEYIKRMSLVQWICLGLMLASIVYTLLVALVPELAAARFTLVYAYLLYMIVTFVGVIAIGGREAKAEKGISTRKQKRELRNKIHELENRKAAIAVRFADVIAAHRDVAELGGSLTQDQQVLYRTYETQTQAIQAQIDSLSHSGE